MTKAKVKINEKEVVSSKGKQTKCCVFVYLYWVIEPGKFNKMVANFWKYEHNYFKSFMEKQKIWQTQNNSEKNINEQAILIWSSPIKLQYSR